MPLIYFESVEALPQDQIQLSLTATGGLTAVAKDGKFADSLSVNANLLPINTKLHE